jgi:N-acetylglucosamine kinase-like BadF-type ATPase
MSVLYFEIVGVDSGGFKCMRVRVYECMSVLYFEIVGVDSGGSKCMSV